MTKHMTAAAELRANTSVPFHQAQAMPKFWRRNKSMSSRMTGFAPGVLMRCPIRATI